jgi:Tol biopolymer transport system component
MDSDGTNQTNITKTPDVDELYPDFSPDGSRMCLYLGDLGPGSGPGSGIYVMNADGSDPTRLTDEHAGVGCEWSPDGKKIAYSYHPDFRGGKWPDDVYVMNADGSGKVNLTSNPERDTSPTWSPDGMRIAFASDRDGDYEIYTMRSDGSNVAHVTANSNTKDVDPDWHFDYSEAPAQEKPLSNTGGTAILAPAMGLLLISGAVVRSVVRKR